MSDDRVRAARRASLTAGDAESKARLIVERMRTERQCAHCDDAHEWSPCALCIAAPWRPNGWSPSYRTRVLLACYCNDEAARIAVFGTTNPAAHEIPPGLVWIAVAPFDGVELVTDHETYRVATRPRFDYHRWFNLLRRWGPVVKLLATIELAEELLDRWETDELIRCGFRDPKASDPPRSALLTRIGANLPRRALLAARECLQADVGGKVADANKAYAAWVDAWRSAVESMHERGVGVRGPNVPSAWSRAAGWLPDPRFYPERDGPGDDWPGPLTCGAQALTLERPVGLATARSIVQRGLVSFALDER